MILSEKVDEFQQEMLGFLDGMKRLDNLWSVMGADFTFYIEAQKEILGRIQGFISGDLKQKIKERISIGDLTLFKIFAEFNQGLLNGNELISELYKNFDGFYGYVKYGLVVEEEEAFALTESGFSEFERQIARDIVSCANGKVRHEDVLGKYIDKMQMLEEFDEKLQSAGHRRTVVNKSG